MVRGAVSDLRGRPRGVQAQLRDPAGAHASRRSGSRAVVDRRRRPGRAQLRVRVAPDPAGRPGARPLLARGDGGRPGRPPGAHRRHPPGRHGAQGRRAADDAAEGGAADHLRPHPRHDRLLRRGGPSAAGQPRVHERPGMDARGSRRARFHRYLLPRARDPPGSGGVHPRLHRTLAGLPHPDPRRTGHRRRLGQRGALGRNPHRDRTGRHRPQAGRRGTRPLLAQRARGPGPGRECPGPAASDPERHRRGGGPPGARRPAARDAGAAARGGGRGRGQRPPALRGWPLDHRARFGGRGRSALADRRQPGGRARSGRARRGAPPGRDHRRRGHPRGDAPEPEWKRAAP